MPLYKKIQTGSYAVFVWKVTETYDELIAVLPHSDIFRNEAERRFTSMKRRLEFAAVRVALYVAAGIDYPEIGYMASGKPFLLHDPRELSVSHTQNYVAVMLTEDKMPGVDIERRSDRIVNLKSRIIGPEELADSPECLLLHWSAKETAYKIMQCRDVDFVRHLKLSVLPEYIISDGIKKSGEAVMKTVHPDYVSSFMINYVLDDEFILTYSVASKKAHQDNLCNDNAAKHG